MSKDATKIIHISDLHLFVDHNGNNRSPNLQSNILINLQNILKSKFVPAAVTNFGNGLNAHSRSALSALWKSLDDIIQNKKKSELLLMVQSGDVEAYGYSGDIQNAYPSFDYWENQKNQNSSNVDRFIDIYGNHDIWPQLVPIGNPIQVKKAVDLLRNRNEFNKALPDCNIIHLNNYRLEIYRLNTICCAWPLNTLAVGKIQPDYPIREGIINKYPASSTIDPIKELVELSINEVKKNPDEPAVRVIVMHHPPHYFQSTIWDELSGGRLLNRRDLTSTLSTHKFHLILGGHRHITDPPQNVNFPKSDQSQKPLPFHTVQLSAGSATQKVSVPNSERPSFGLYEIHINDQINELIVNRTIYKYESDLDTKFTAQISHPVKNIDL